MPSRLLPNIVICGTPATGKSTLARALVASLSPPTSTSSTTTTATSTPTSTSASAPTSALGSTSPSTPTSAPPEFTCLDLNALSEVHACRTAYDKQRSAWVIDEGALADALTPQLEAGGCVIDWMHGDFWERGLVDLVVVVRASTEVLYDRYVARGYAARKREENMDAEILGEVAEEVRGWFAQGEDDEDEDGDGDEEDEVWEGEIWEVRMEKKEDEVENVKRLEEWVGKWKGQD